jgi:uncharacterized protein (TIGR03083 family)
MGTRPPLRDPVTIIEEHSSALVRLVRSHDLATPVRTCGDWTLADLAWHLAEVQHFWAWVIAHRPDAPDDYTEPDRPGDGSLADVLAGCGASLASALRTADPSEPAWSWSADRSVGFTMRRQSHEALVHRIDGALATATGMPEIDPVLAADGVDEMLTVFLSGVPDWATFRADGTTIRLSAPDTADAWLLGLGRMTGVSPTTGSTHDLDAAELREPGRPADATVIAPAGLLDLWLWGRLDDGRVELAGDLDVVARLRRMITESTQ